MASGILLVADIVIVLTVATALARGGWFSRPTRRAVLLAIIAPVIVAIGSFDLYVLGRTDPLLLLVAGLAMLAHPIATLYAVVRLRGMPMSTMAVGVATFMLAAIAFVASAVQLIAMPAYVLLALVLSPYAYCGWSLARNKAKRVGVAVVRERYAALATVGMAGIVIGSSIIAADVGLAVIEWSTLMVAFGFFFALTPPQGFIRMWRASTMDFLRRRLPEARADVSREAFLDRAAVAIEPLVAPGTVTFRGLQDVFSVPTSPRPHHDLSNGGDRWRCRVGDDEEAAWLEVTFGWQRFDRDDDRELVEAIAEAVTARRRAILFMRQQAERLEETKALVAAKSDFLRSVGHELGNPLSPIRLQLAILEKKAPDEMTRGFEIIRRNVDFMADIIQNLKDVAKMQDAKVALDLRPADVCEIVRDAVEAAAPVAAEKGLRMSFQGEEAMANVDAGRLRQVFTNLVSNAIKYTPEGDVHVTIRAEDDIRVSVQDTGLGLTSEQISQMGTVYERFHKDQGIEGTGLGMFVTKSIVEAHGGELVVESGGPGKGCTFAVVLPVK